MFDEWDPANVSPLVAYLSSDGMPVHGETFFVQGGTVHRVRSWEIAERSAATAHGRSPSSPRPMETLDRYR